MIDLAQLGRIARANEAFPVQPSIMLRLAQARARLDEAARDRRIYGYNTGLGANLGAVIPPEEAARFQAQLLRGRAVAVGAPLARDEVRAVMAARLAMLANGGSGISPESFLGLADLLARDVHPQVPAIGSIGESDLPSLAFIGLALIGEGTAEFRGEILPGAEALSRAGLAPLALRPKDGLALISANAVSVGLGALAAIDGLELARLQLLAGALGFDGYGANPAILDPRLHAARPGPGQAAAAAKLHALVAGQGGALQDPLAFRCLPIVQGLLDEAFARLAEIVVLELGSAADSPLVLDDGDVLSTANFDASALASRAEAAALALAQAARQSLARITHLTGTKPYLSPVGGASAGFVPMQKTATALALRIRHAATPMAGDGWPVSEAAEDHASFAPATVAKLRGALEDWRRLIAIELIAAAQAAELHGAANSLIDAVREIVPKLVEDRSLGPDVDSLAVALAKGGFAGTNS